MHDLGIAHLVDRDPKGHLNPTAPLFQIMTAFEDSLGRLLLPRLLDFLVVHSLSPSEVSLILLYFRAIVLPQDPLNLCQSTLLRLIPKARCTSRGVDDDKHRVTRQLAMGWGDRTLTENFRPLNFPTSLQVSLRIVRAV
jgi:hypothetical protein